MKIFIIILSIVVISCCAGNKEIDRTGESITYTDVDTEWEMSLDTLLATTEYIPLETVTESLLGEIQSIKFDDNLYFIRDVDKVLVFDNNGKFVNRIGTAGRGPNEYTYIHDFFLDRTRNTVSILDRQKKRILTYNYDGTFRKSTILDMDGRQNKFAETDAAGNLIIYYSLLYDGVGNSNYQYEILDYNDKGYVHSYDLFENYVYSGSRGLMAIAQYPVSYSNDRVLLLSNFSNVIYEYKNGVVSPAYSVQTDKAIADKSYFEQNRSVEYVDLVRTMQANGTYFAGLNNILETSQYLMLLLEGKKSLIWDKINKAGIAINHLLNPATDSYSIVMSHLFGIGNDDHVTGVVNAIQIIDNKDKILASGDESLKKLVLSIDESSNPVLCLYYFKNDAVTQFRLNR